MPLVPLLFIRQSQLSGRLVLYHFEFLFSERRLVRNGLRGRGVGADVDLDAGGAGQEKVAVPNQLVHLLRVFALVFQVRYYHELLLVFHLAHLVYRLSMLIIGAVRFRRNLRLIVEKRRGQVLVRVAHAYLRLLLALLSFTQALCLFLCAGWWNLIGFRVLSGCSL